jgi:D-sedoheptulose 7-phosphate isomerase
MTDFLYPFIESEEQDPVALLRQLSTSVDTKTDESIQLSRAVVEREADRIEAVAQEMAERFRAGGQLLTFGNGGSTADADAFAALIAGGDRRLPARSLVEDPGIITAIGNDVGFDLVFSRQVIAYGRTGDMAAGFSTSGNSANLIKAFDQARSQGLLTIGLAGYDGGEMGRGTSIDHCFVVPSQSVHRIQEAQSALILALGRAVIRRCAE